MIKSTFQCLVFVGCLTWKSPKKRAIWCISKPANYSKLPSDVIERGLLENVHQEWRFILGKSSK
jgi:hypothetical protein